MPKCELYTGLHSRSLVYFKSSNKKISGHSIRVGAAQDLCLAGKTLPQIMAKGRWVKTDTLMRYVEHTII